MILGGLREIAEEPVSAGVGMCTAGSFGHMQAKPLLDRVFLLHLLYPVLSIGRYQRGLTIYI